MTAQGKRFVTSECLGERDQLPNRRGSYKNVDDASEDGPLPAELQRRGRTGTGQRGPVDTADDAKKPPNAGGPAGAACGAAAQLALRSRPGAV